MTDNKKWREFYITKDTMLAYTDKEFESQKEMFEVLRSATHVIEHKAYQDLKERVDRLAEAIEKSFNDHDDEEMYHTLDKALKEYRGEK